MVTLKVTHTEHQFLTEETLKEFIAYKLRDVKQYRTTLTIDYMPLPDEGYYKVIETTYGAKK